MPLRPLKRLDRNLHKQKHTFLQGKNKKDTLQNVVLHTKVFCVTFFQKSNEKYERTILMRHLIDILELTTGEIEELINVAEDIIGNPKSYSEKCRGKKLATLFFEPSTRTRLSFEAAMYELGGNVLGFSEAKNSSAAKGECISDTARTVSCYADIIAMRHPVEGAPYVASLKSDIPIINAGDGGHNHPTQTLTDLLTIHREKGTFENLTIGLCGDLKYGRTVHSLILAMSRYKNVKFVLISPDELTIPSYVKDVLESKNIEHKYIKDLEDAMGELDVLYMTRVQRERFKTEEEYERLKNCYILTVDKLKNAKDDLSIMHPLPRVNEISHEIDDDKRACYFKQMLYGKYIRMALILKLLEAKENGEVIKEKDVKTVKNVYKCKNRRCITNNEEGIENIFKLVDEKTDLYRCIYCEARAKKDQ